MSGDVFSTPRLSVPLRIDAPPAG